MAETEAPQAELPKLVYHEPPELLGKLEDFFCSPAFTTPVGGFFKDNNTKLKLVPLQDEQPHENYAVFKEYADLVEKKLEEFLAENGVTAQQLYEDCSAHRELAKSGTQAPLTCLDYLIAATQYEMFMNLAHDFIQMDSWDDNRYVEWEGVYVVPPSDDAEGSVHRAHEVDEDGE
eukprot:jgi/Mesvir1/27147/Mv20815-RA.1